MGLAISKRIVEMMGGTLHVESKLDEGSTFWFEIKLKKGQEIMADKESQKPLQNLSKNHLQILVVEDNIFNQKVCAKMLAKLGYNYDIASNGQEALDALDHHKYNLVLMDCEMPIMDGYRASQEIRKRDDSQIRNIPVIALTANALKGAKESCQEAGMNDYLCKPFAIDKLAEKIDQWVSGADWSGSSMRFK